MPSDVIREKFEPFGPFCKKVEIPIEITFDETFGKFTDEERAEVEKDVAEKIGTTYTKMEWCEKHIDWIVWDDEEEGRIDEDCTNSNMREFDEWMENHDSCEGFTNGNPHAYIDVVGSVESGWKAYGPEGVEAEGVTMTKTWDMVVAKLGSSDLPVHYNL